MSSSLRSDTGITEFTNNLGSPISPFLGMQVFIFPVSSYYAAGYRSKAVCVMRLQSQDQPTSMLPDTDHDALANNNEILELEKEILIEIPSYALGIIMEETASENKELEILE